MSKYSPLYTAGGCPVDIATAMLRVYRANSCGKCTPCRVGLDKLFGLMEKVVAFKATAEELALIRSLATSIYDSADCAIGYEAAKMVLDGLAAHEADYLAHVEKHSCTAEFGAIPCQLGCPARVDIPGYIACVGAKRFADAVRVIRKDNPFPAVCGLICEHPCEMRCRRLVVDDAINIRALKRYAVEQVGEVPVPKSLAPNGKKVAVIGGGPAGLSAAYYLALKGFKVTIFERRQRLGGMLRYGIPAYRLPDAWLDKDINAILSLGVEVKYNTNITDLDALRSDYDAVYLTIGAHGAKSLRVEGETAKGVLSAVELLGAVGEGKAPDFSGKRVVIVGGGNVAMDATRTSMRLKAKSVTCVYRRRIADMTALPEEIIGAQAEGCEILPMMAPVRVEVKNDAVVGLVVKPQIPGAMKDGRPSPCDSTKPETTIPADIIVVAIGQDIESKSFVGLETNRGAFVADKDGKIADHLYTGGDCFTGPSTVIRAIASGKRVAELIGKDFGVDMTYSDKVEVPPPAIAPRLDWGRVETSERSASERKGDFELMENGLSEEEALQECSRCLRCDTNGKADC